MGIRKKPLRIYKSEAFVYDDSAATDLDHAAMKDL